MTEIKINAISREEWDDFVLAHPRATFAHLWGWKEVIGNVYGHPAYYFEAWEDGMLAGVLPMIFIKSRLFGRQLISMPYLDTGGPLCTTAGALAGLVGAAAEKAADLKADISLRMLDDVESRWQTSTNKVTMHLELEKDPKALLKKIPSERRNRIRKADRNGLETVFKGAESLDTFYAIFSENMKDLGSPVHGKDFFREILKAFGSYAGLIIVENESGKAIGSGLYFRFRDTLSLPWVSSLRDEFKLYPNIILYWELIKWGCENGFEVFDFGRSTIDSGTFEFKRRWGAQPVQLYWQFYSQGEGTIESLDADSTKNRIMIAVWKKLPLSVANAFGPMLRKSISL